MIPEALPDPAASNELHPHQVNELMASIKSGGIRLIDCRESEEWDITHLDHAELIPLSNFSTRARPLVETKVPCIVYCHHGMRSLSATQWLRQHGLTQSWSMHGGIDAWSTLIDPSVPRY